MRKIVLSVLSLLVLAVLLPATVLALGVAMGPTSLEITNALRGGQYERSVTVFNPSEPETKYNLMVEGQAADWVSFHDLNATQIIDSLIIPGESNTTVLLKIKVPSDIANGNYTATIIAETAAIQGSGETGVSTVMQAQSGLTVTVTGTQIIAGTVISIETQDTEAGLPLRLKVDFKNTGNISVTPQIDCIIIRDSEMITQFSYTQTEVRAEAEVTIPIEWATNTDQVGNYIARVSVLLTGQLLETKELNFSLLPPGTLTKQGEIINLTYEGQPILNSIIKIVSAFKNTGQGDARAKLIAEVNFNGVLIDTAVSEETLIPVGQDGTLTAYYKLTQKGQYFIRGYITFDGKQTATKEIIVTASSESDQTLVQEQENQSWKLWLPVAIITLLAISTVAFFLWRRSKKAYS
jgi:hypothetical protein